MCQHRNPLLTGAQFEKTYAGSSPKVMSVGGDPACGGKTAKSASLATELYIHIVHQGMSGSH
ncbi:hypothetical protein GGH95_003485 [Coemansia sp. RSA 1836]|nr:hypothetical protein GGH95_003485 [Coemansia sp. RSA 1836]